MVWLMDDVSYREVVVSTQIFCPIVIMSQIRTSCNEEVGMCVHTNITYIYIYHVGNYNLDHLARRHDRHHIPKSFAVQTCET